MKKYIASALVIAAMTSCNEPGIEFSGIIRNAAGKTICLSQIDLNKTFVIDSVKINDDGTFSLNVPRSNEPTFFMAQLNDGKNQITFITDSLTENISVEADLKATNWQKSIVFGNSEESAQLNELISRVDALQTEFVAVASNPKLSQDERRVASEKFMENIKAHKDFVQKYVFEHPRSFVSYFALFQTVFDMPIFDMMTRDDLILYNTVATSLRIIYPNNARVSDLCNRVLLVRHAMAQQKRTDEIMKTAQEVNSPDIALPDSKGEIRKLSDLKGKIVILQFWASQSEDSRKLNKQLNKLYEKYNSKGLEIYQVSVDTSKLLWENALSTDGLKWCNVCDFMGGNSTAVRLYNITAVPSNYIIGRDGSLIGKDLFGTRLDNRMAELFK